LATQTTGPMSCKHSAQLRENAKSRGKPRTLRFGPDLSTLLVLLRVLSTALTRFMQMSQWKELERKQEEGHDFASIFMVAHALTVLCAHASVASQLHYIFPCLLKNHLCQSSPCFLTIRPIEARKFLSRLETSSVCNWRAKVYFNEATHVSASSRVNARNRNRR